MHEQANEKFMHWMTCAHLPVSNPRSPIDERMNETRTDERQRRQHRRPPSSAPRSGNQGSWLPPRSEDLTCSASSDVKAKRVERHERWGPRMPRLEGEHRGRTGTHPGHRCRSDLPGLSSSQPPITCNARAERTNVSHDQSNRSQSQRTYIKAINYPSHICYI